MFISKETQQKVMQPEISSVAKTTKLKISEHISNLPQVNSASLSSDDIAQIVKIVMNKMDTKKSNSITIEEQTSKTNTIPQQALVQSDESYTKALMTQDVDELKGRSYKAEIKKLNTKEMIENSPSLQASNHYNKVIIHEDKKSNLDSLSKLSTQISSEVNAYSSKSETTDYTQAITKEIATRSNEMRIIVVQKGDTLSRLAKRAYGKYDDYVKILTANPEVIKNPDHIYVGQRLRIPAGS